MQNIIIYQGYQIKPHKQYPTSWVVVTDGKGGKIPDVLSSLFTSVGIAKQQIDQYLTKKVKHAEAVNQG